MTTNINTWHCAQFVDFLFVDYFRPCGCACQEFSKNTPETAAQVLLLGQGKMIVFWFFVLFCFFVFVLFLTHSLIRYSVIKVLRHSISFHLPDFKLCPKIQSQT